MRKDVYTEYYNGMLKRKLRIADVVLIIKIPCSIMMLQVLIPGQ